MNFVKANQIKKRNLFLNQEDKLNAKRLKPRESAPAYKFEPIKSKLNKYIDIYISEKLTIHKKPLTHHKLNNIRLDLKEDSLYLTSKDLNSDNSCLPQFRSLSQLKENNEEKIKTEEVNINQDSFSKKRNSISLNDIRISPLKELINGSKSRKDLKYMFKNDHENSEQKRKNIEEMMRYIHEAGNKTMNTLALVQMDSSINKNIKSIQESVINEVNESIEMSIIKQNIQKNEGIESTNEKNSSKNNYLISSIDTKCNLSSSVRSNVDMERNESITNRKEIADIENSVYKANVSDPSITINNIDNIYRSLGQYDELVIETLNDNIIGIPKSDLLQNRMVKINLLGIDDPNNEIDNEIDLNIIASRKKFMTGVWKETADTFKYSPDQVKLVEKDNLKQNIRHLENQIENLQKEINSERSKHKKEISSFNISMEVLMNELKTGEIHRRKLHTFIQELRGSIRVFCRVKPVSNELENDLSTCIKYPEMSLNPKAKDKGLYSLELYNCNSTSANNSSNTFHFDRVFPEDCEQLEIFNEVKPFIQSALDGENVCLFAYGPTGSGKTFTMQGPSFDCERSTELRGILPRTADFIFDELTRLQGIGFNFKLFFAAMEVYNENIFDLLNPKDKTPLQTYSLKNNNIQVKNLTWNQILTKEDINKFTKEASETRRSDSTKFNAQSSRSHAIFQIKIERTNKNNTESQSLINIIDLAGSERNSIDSFEDKSKTEVENMKKIQQEANFINKSLTTLGRIINMLGDKNSNKSSIPYRESKLTMILQSSLKPGSKTAMIVNICSAKKLYNITKEALNFAKNAMMNC